MISRRQLLLGVASSLLFPAGLYANSKIRRMDSWPEFHYKMTALANANSIGKVNNSAVTKLGMQYLKQLDVDSDEFETAVKDSYETSNDYWLWQRMVKQQNIKGGILGIEREQIIPLHDHPGATGMMRILSGTVEVWIFDEVKQAASTAEADIVDLALVSHRTLSAGDTAVLTPNKGNIHALRAISEECRMLDFFIPPYSRSKRSWFEPTNKNWFEEKTISCKKIPQYAYNKA